MSWLGNKCQLDGYEYATLGDVLEQLNRDPILSYRGMPLNLAAAAPTTC